MQHDQAHEGLLDVYPLVGVDAIVILVLRPDEDNRASRTGFAAFWHCEALVEGQRVFHAVMAA